jgi:hypothetical protein
VTACAMGTEFGRVLERLVELPGAAGAVLSDDRGYAIDFVRTSPGITDLDVQLLGAQLGQTLHRLDGGLGPRGLRAPIVVLETPGRTLLAAPVASDYSMALLFDAPIHLALAMQRFEDGWLHMARLLS